MKNKVFLSMALLANGDYRSCFLKEVRRHLQGALRPENVLAHIARQRDLVAPVMKKELEAFYRPGAYPEWVRNVAEMERFARFRGEVFEGHMRDFISGLSSGGAATGAEPAPERF